MVFQASRVIAQTISLPRFVDWSTFEPVNGSPVNNEGEYLMFLSRVNCVDGLFVVTEGYLERLSYCHGCTP